MKFALKRLTISDLGFFEVHFDKANVSGQKGLNLNRRVFIDRLYPDLPELLAKRDWAMPVALELNGPGASFRTLQLSRKITKKSSRNYRLNGELVANPKEDTARFAELTVGDIALLGFDGAGAPSRVSFFAVAASNPDDLALYEALSAVTGSSMSAIEADRLAELIAVAPESHPVHDLFIERTLVDDLEQAAQGDAEATGRLLARPGERRVSAEQLAAARRRAEEIGADGELIVRAYFDQGVPGVETAVWSSSENAISAWDFKITAGGDVVLVEVKATRSPHEAPFHISLAELQAAAHAPRYHLYRVSELDDDGGVLRIAEGVPPVAISILTALDALPKGVRPDGFSLDPALFQWSDPVDLAWPDAEET
ncbi:MAG: DUF3883 domain-containing protein [Caulobacter sp.]|nr:DUF3883 domain-containing protein [Caulobacter sp.]